MIKNANSLDNKPLYRIGCTSFIVIDDILPNVEKAAPYVDDIELILFESDNSFKFKNLGIIKDLKRIAHNNNLSFTIHLPIDKKINYKADSDNSFYFNQIKRIIELTHPLDPFAYIIHLDGINSSASKSEVHAWRDSCGKFCADIAAIPNLDHEKICLENLNYPIDWFIDFQEIFDFSLCLDIGHLWMNEDKWYDIFKKYLLQTRVIHLHGVCNGKDHKSLKKNDNGNVYKVLSQIEYKYKGVLTLEVFSWKDFLESFDIIKKFKVV